MDELPVELAKAAERFDRKQERIVKTEGWGATAQGIALATKVVPKLSKLVSDRLGNINQKDPYEKQLAPLLRELDADVVAWAIVSATIHGLATSQILRHIMMIIGKQFEGECWAAGLTHDEPKVAARIEKWARARHATPKYRKTVAKALAQSHGFKAKGWSRELRVRAGAWGLDRLLAAAPELFVKLDGNTNRRGEYVLTLTDEAVQLMDAAIAEVIERKPVFMPITERPKAWDWVTGGGSWDKRLIAQKLVRTNHKSTQADIKAAIKGGSMRPCLRAVNTLQEVAWTINKPVLGVLRECWRRGIQVPGLPRKEPISLPEHGPWEAMNDLERSAYRSRAYETKMANLALKGDQVGMIEDLQIAESLSEHERFWTPMNLDWRGRVYGIPHFNFQRDDRVRALFLFADGEPVGEEGLYWLKVHLANCGDFDKISKRSFDERVKWVDDNLSQIETVAEVPTNELWWTRADKPFLFLAACLEYVSALRSASKGAIFVTRLPVSFDGSCSGLQHLCAMTRAAEGKLVNLTPGELPQDVYQVVADRVKERIENDDNEDNKLHRQQVLEYGITRKLVKRNVMTYSYSSKKYGMAQQQVEDLMQPLVLQVLEGKLEEHPFGQDKGYAASRYIAQHVYAAIEEVVEKPAQAMGFLQRLAKAAAHEGKPLRWKTPVELPWINRYHTPVTKRVRLYMHDRGVSVPYTMVLAVGDQREINKDKAANGVAPNFVHALDAAHLMLTVNAAAEKGITRIATVHDSFGCLATHASEFRRIIREQFVRMYEQHDPLAEVLEQAKCDLTQHTGDTLPPVPTRGPLNLRDILDADFAFA